MQLSRQALSNITYGVGLLIISRLRGYLIPKWETRQPHLIYR